MRGDSVRRFARLIVDILVALAVIGLCVGLHRFGLMRLIEGSDSFTDAALTAIRRLGVIGALLAGYVFVAKVYERRQVEELRLRPLVTALSAIAGSTLIGLTILGLLATGNYEFVALRHQTTWLGVVGAILTAALLEEAVFRGIVFRLIEERVGTVRALVVQAVIFGALHLFNEGSTMVTVVSVTLIGAFWALIFVYTRNLWAVSVNHFAWNVTIFLSGLPLSGQDAWRARAPLETAEVGSVWLTGGMFGPEDSVVTVVVMTYTVVRLYQVCRGTRKIRLAGSEERKGSTFRLL